MPAVFDAAVLQCAAASYDRGPPVTFAGPVPFADPCRPHAFTEDDDIFNYGSNQPQGSAKNPNMPAHCWKQQAQHADIFLQARRDGKKGDPCECEGDWCEPCHIARMKHAPRW